MSPVAYVLGPDWAEALWSIRDIVVGADLMNMFLASPAMNDLRPGSAGIQYLNSNNIETFNRVGIIGLDLDPAHEPYRLAFTQLANDPQLGADIQDFLYAVYAIVAYIYWEYGDWLWDEGYISDAYTAWAIGDIFYASAVDIAYAGYHWKIVNGSIIYSNGDYGWTYSDGVVPDYSQDYPNANRSPRIIYNTNHLLEGRSNRGKDAISLGLNDVGFVHMTPPPAPITVSVTPQPSQAPAGGSYTFTANVANGSGNYTVKWYSYYNEGGGTGGEIAMLKEGFVPPGGGTWTYIGTGPTKVFQPSSKHQLRADATDNVSGQVASYTISWY
ncbi:MAG TPA: hypothetical protein PKJ64_02370 [bacterium]|nr:hypothetical protein [bacterium]HNI11448.1 hypothetical protein [bacterium]HNJ71090.1 hypothetical protein [bacterium]HNM13588.1 hypothetical protein [bacterium]